MSRKCQYNNLEGERTMSALFNEQINIMHIVKSECLRSITMKYGAYGSILAYATYKTEYKKNGATKYLRELQEYINQGELYTEVMEQVNEIINDTLLFVEEGIIKRSWTTYIQSIRELFNKKDTDEIVLPFDKALWYYKDIKDAVEVRVDLLIEQKQDSMKYSR